MRVVYGDALEHLVKVVQLTEVLTQHKPSGLQEVLVQVDEGKNMLFVLLLFGLATAPLHL